MNKPQENVTEAIAAGVLIGFAIYGYIQSLIAVSSFLFISN